MMEVKIAANPPINKRGSRKRLIDENE